MILVPLQALPSQSLSITLDENYYEINLYIAGGNLPGTEVMGMDITRNGVAIITGQRCVPGYPVIPYQYLEDGNFGFITENDDYPDYRQFGVTQNLYYASSAELAALRAGT